MQDDPLHNHVVSPVSEQQRILPEDRSSGQINVSRAPTLEHALPVQYREAGDRMIDWEQETDEQIKKKWNDIRQTLEKHGSNSSSESLKAIAPDDNDFKRLVLIRGEEDGLSLLNVALDKDVNAPAEVVELLLDADPDNLTIRQENTDGYLPIHMAAERRSSSTIIDLLLEADQDKQTILERTRDVTSRHSKGKRAIHLALECNAPAETIQILLDADKESSTVSNRVLIYLLNGYQLKQSWVDDHMAKPLLLIILDPNSEKTQFDKALKDAEEAGARPSRTFAYDKSNAIGGTLGFTPVITYMTDEDFLQGHLPVHVYPMLARSIAKSPDLQDLVNENSIERHVVAVMLADFYANSALIVVFLYASWSYVMTYPEGSAHSGYLVGLDVLAGYFLLIRQSLKATSRNKYYVFNLWNFVDVCRAVLVLASSISLHVDNEDNYKQNRNLLLWTGALVFVGMISFLRSTFLPFSFFVSGVVQIFRTLLPFFVVTGLVLMAFAFMYFIQRFDKDDDFHDLKASFYTVYGYFVGGPDQPRNGLDIVFGLVAIIIFLNVVIAIVSNAWDEASAHGAEAFWYYRLKFLAELRPLETILLKEKLGLGKLGRLIDKVGDKKVKDQIPWGVKPYSFVRSKKEYLLVDREDVLETIENDIGDEKKAKEMMKELENMRSFQSDWTLLNDRKERFKTFLRFIKWLVSMFLLFLLGLVTFGFFWPKNIRMWVFGSNKTGAGESTEGKKSV